MKQLHSKAPETLVYVDESGLDDAEDYPYGWCQRGQRFHALKLGHRTTRISMIAALQNHQLIAPLTFEGYCNRQVFQAWVEQELLPVVQRGQTVILDNASFHKSATLSALIAQAGCELLYLPPYSPDLNQIEHYWSPLKNTIRKTIPLYDSFREAVDAAFC